MAPVAPVEGGSDEPKKYVVGAAVTVSVARKRVQYLNAQGKRITESLRDHTRINLGKHYDSLDQFLQAWNTAERKAALLQELEGQGVLLDALADELGQAGLDLDPFDLLLQVAYNQPPLTRRERAGRVKKRNVFTEYGPVARKVMAALLDQYADTELLPSKTTTCSRCSPSTRWAAPVGCRRRARLNCNVDSITCKKNT